jgi:SprT protein
MNEYEILDARVRARVIECMEIILGKERASEFDIPVSYRNDMGSVAGYAYTDDLRIEFNAQLFISNIDNFFFDTIPHEVAHILVEILYPLVKQDHGKEWRDIMHKLGITKPKRNHRYDVSVSITTPRYRYTCACTGRQRMVTKIIHNKMIRGQKRFCHECDTQPIYSPNENTHTN